MRCGLIGHTGFVGGNLARQAKFDAFFNTQNIESIAGDTFDLLAISGMPAAKWIANGDPAGDRRGLDRLLSALRKVRAEVVVLISTVDVYPRPIDVDESTPIDPAAQEPYGRHRLILEQEVASEFSRVLTVRLPGLFGPGLRKNALFDLLHDNNLHKVHALGSFQFYPVDWLWRDIRTALESGLSLINFATEPFTIREAAVEAFGKNFENIPGGPPAKYDVRSAHASTYDGSNGYLYDRQAVMNELRRFVNDERSGRP